MLLRLRVSLFLLIVQSALAVASNTPANSKNNTVCGFVGNPDIYGVGIRVGYYTQGLAAWITRYFVAQEGQTIRSTNLLFLFAVFIGLAWLCRQPASVHAVEPYILIQLLLTTWYCGVSQRSLFSRKYSAFSPMIDVTTTFTMCGVCAYNFWYWWHSLDQMIQTPCGTYVFFFAKVRIYGWIRILFKIFAVHFIYVVVVWQTKDCFGMLHYSRFGHHLSSQFFSILDKTLEERIAVLDNASPTNTSREQLSTLPSHYTPPTSEDLGIVASAVPLPPSPTDSITASGLPSGQHSSKADAGAQQSPRLPSFEDMQAAETYLDSLLAVQSNAKELRTTVFSVILPMLGQTTLYAYSLRGLARYFRQHISPIFTSSQPLRFIPIIYPTITYLNSLSKRDIDFPARVFSEALKTPNHTTVNATALNAVLAFRGAQTSANRPLTSYLLVAVWSLLTWMYFIVEIETALVWNGVSGLSGMGAIGQLIPAIIGVGGLTRVLWIWFVEGRGRPMEERDDAANIDIKACAATYDNAKRKLAATGGSNPLRG